MKNYLILCLALLIPLTSHAQTRSKKRLYSASITVENTLGINPTVAAYYSLPKKPWTLGLKYRHISTTISDIKLNGSFIGLEAQRYIWHKSRLQLWGSAEAGMVNTEMDLSYFSALESKIKKSEIYLGLGADLRYNLTQRLRLTVGMSVFHDSLNKEFEGNSGIYKLETEPFHLGYRGGLLYFF